MNKKTFRISAGIMAVIIGALIFLNIKQDSRQDWDACFEMANARIEWTGAGYNGIYGR